MKLDHTTRLRNGSLFIRNEERRAFPRWPLRINAACYSDRTRFECSLTELSEAGACFYSAARPDVGATITLAFGLSDGDEPVTVECRVRRITEGRTGVEFLNITAANRLRILHSVSRGR